MRINTTGTESVRHQKARRLVLRSFGASLALLAALSIGVLAAPGSPASAAAGPTWAGTGAVLPANAAPGAASELFATSCPAPGNCVSVGAYQSGGQSVGLIDAQSGGSWTAMEAPTPANAGVGTPAGLIDVDCVSVGSCTAAGLYDDTSGHQQGLLLTETGGTWTATEAPLPADARANPNVTLISESCAAPGVCVVTGIYFDTAGNPRGLLLTESGGAWTEANAPLPPGASATQASILLAASCPATGSCAVVGEYENSGGDSEGLVLTQAGGAWSETGAPLPADAAPIPQAALDRVSCPAVGTCMATGEYTDALGNLSSVIESISNGTVTDTRAPLPPGAKTSGSGPTPGDELLGLSCPSTQYCVATGVYRTQTSTLNGGAPLIETYSGGAWTATAAPGSLDPSFASILVGVSCSWPGSCSAVGMSRGTGSTSGFLETLSNGTWSESPAVLPADAKVPNQVTIGSIGEGLPGDPISCVAGTCVLSGSYATISLESGFIDTFPNLAGYQLVASDGGMFAFNAPFFGSMGGQPLNQPVVGMAVVPDSGGYYEVAADGGIFAFGAPFQGSMGGTHLNKPVVGIAFDSRTGGYYEVASDGGIFAFNAPFYGSMGGTHLNKPVVGIGFDAVTGGYYEVASDGGIFAFNAPFMGSTGSLTLNKPMVGMAVDGATGGYYEVASDGGIFAYGAPFMGSTGSLTLNKPMVGMATDYLTGGYYEVASDGGIFAFGAPFQGSTGSIALNKPVVGMAFG